MKTKTLEPKAAQLRRERLTKLIRACREKFSDEEIVEAFNKESFSEYAELDGEEMKSVLIANDYLVFDDENSLDKHIASKSGYLIFKPQTMQQETQLREFAETVFPYYSDQQACIL